MQRNGQRRWQPLYLKISESLIEAIARGKYSVGSTLPTEHQFCDMLGVSRSTMIAALNRLEDLGLVVRRPRHGTRVVSRFPTQSLVKDGGIIQDWARYGSEYKMEVVSKDLVPMPPGADAEGRAKRDGKWLRIFARRFPPRSREPICHTLIYVHPDYRAVRKDIPARPPMMIFSLIEARFGSLIRSVEQELKAINLSAAMAKDLNVKPGVAALQIVRRYLGPRGKVIEYAIDTHRPDKFSYMIEVRRSAGD
ncbi:MAG: GntR family transcriptional regulator [Proteobacteria bacterium]|nr:GntR family transcriptional regulator [Pseudomonadota bacterium]